MAKLVTAADTNPDLLINEAVDLAAAGFEPPAYTNTDETRLQVWAAERLAERSAAIEIDVDPAERDRILRDARDQWGVKPKYRSRGRWWKISLLVIAGMIVLAAIFIMRAQTSLPGERLWELKRWTEGVRMSMASGDEKKAERALANTRERLKEADILIVKGRPDYARAVLFEFYRESEDVRRRMRDMSREKQVDLFAEQDRQAVQAAELDKQLNGEESQHEEPVSPVVGTRSPTPRPPWLPESPLVTPAQRG